MSLESVKYKPAKRENSAQCNTAVDLESVLGCCFILC